jgi:RNA polymerase sigma-70 factor (ECF subfamily)
VDARLPAQSQQAALAALDDTELREIVDAYIDAWERADVDAVVTMLAEDATLQMPPQASWFAGREAVAAFLAAYPLATENRWRLVPTRANGQLAFGHYIWSDAADAFVAGEISVLTLRGTRIEAITVFRDPAAVARFGLADRLHPRR